MIELKDIRFRWNAYSDLFSIGSLVIPEKEHLFIYGPSGSGKTTLLQIIASFLKPQQGMVSIHNKIVSELPEAERDEYRNSHLSFLFQVPHLIPYLNVLDNVLLPSFFSHSSVSRPEVIERAILLLKKMGITPSQLTQKASSLSVGEKQRVAAARAFLQKPSLLLADEPTSSLDDENTKLLVNLLKETSEQTTLIIVSHDSRLHEFFPNKKSIHSLLKREKASP